MMQPQTASFLTRIRALVSCFGAVTLGEVSSQDGAYDRCRAYTSGDCLDMAYSLRPARGGFDWASVRELVAQSAAPDGWLCWSFSNHDVERAVTRWNPHPGHAPDPRFARLLMALQLTLRGSVLVYQGEELGLPEAELSAEQLRDPFGIAYWPEFRGRDGCRTPMPWVSEAAHAGFSAGAPWLPVPEAHAALAVDAQEADAGALLQEWRRFLSYRRAHPVLAHGDTEMLALPAPLIGFVRSDANERVVCLFNVSGEGVEVPRCFAGAPGWLGPYGTVVVAQAVEMLAVAAE